MDSTLLKTTATTTNEIHNERKHSAVNSASSTSGRHNNGSSPQRSSSVPMDIVQEDEDEAGTETEHRTASIARTDSASSVEGRPCDNRHRSPSSRVSRRERSRSRERRRGSGAGGDLHRERRRYAYKGHERTTHAAPFTKHRGSGRDDFKRRRRTPEPKRRGSDRKPRSRDRSDHGRRRTRTSRSRSDDRTRRRERKSYRSRSRSHSRERERHKRSSSRDASRPKNRSSNHSPNSGSGGLRSKTAQSIDNNDNNKQTAAAVTPTSGQAEINSAKSELKNPLDKAIEKPSNLPLMDTLTQSGPRIVTAQMAVQQTMAAMTMRAQQITGVTLPKYYNPAAVNPLKYAEQMQKRKLLWQSKEKMVVPAPSTNKWEQTTFSQDQDGKMAAKFKKLMGIKEEAAAAAAAAAGHQPTSADEHQKKQEELFRTLDQQYEVARISTHTQRGVGLGFSSSVAAAATVTSIYNNSLLQYQQQPPPSHFLPK